MHSSGFNGILFLQSTLVRPFSINVALTLSKLPQHDSFNFAVRMRGNTFKLKCKIILRNLDVGTVVPLQDRKSTRDKANINDPTVKGVRPPPTANCTSADCVQISLGSSIQHIPLRVCHTGGFNAMMSSAKSQPFCPGLNTSSCEYECGTFVLSYVLHLIYTSVASNCAYKYEYARESQFYDHNIRYSLLTSYNTTTS